MSVDIEFAAHTDYLNVSVPWDQSGGLQYDLLDACGHGGVSERPEQPGIFDMYGGAGTMLIRRRGPVVVAGFSGQTIKNMRELGLWADVLNVLAALPHRVTLVDAAYDVAVDAPVLLEELYEKYKVVGVRFGQRPAPVSKVGWKVGSIGVETGTVYCGTRQSVVRAKVYDKRQERIDRRFPDPGPWVRYEVTVASSLLGASLRDAWDPTRLFWHYAGGRLLPMPQGMAQWIKGSHGFEVAVRQPKEPFDRLRSFVRDNPNWRRQLELADACGPGGRRWLVAQLLIGQPSAAGDSVAR